MSAATSVPAIAPVPSGSQATTPAPVVGAVAAGRMDIPYAVAAPASASPQVSSVTGSAATALPPVAQMVSSSTVGQHAPPPNAPAAQPAPATAAPAATAPPPASPQVVLAQMVQQALSRQDSIVGLTTALAAIAGKVALPEPVAKAAQQVLAMRMPLDTGPLSGASIKAAVQRSGVFQEALLVSGQGQAAAGDVKSALLGLRQSLGTWLGNQAPIAQLSAVAPPIRGQVPRARSGDGAPPELPDDPVEIGKVLIERTEAALSRLRLHQHASLPDPGAARQDGQWSLDLPVMVAGQQHLLQMQIHRDPEKEADRPEDRGWQVRFAINLAERGEVGAQISLRARTTGVLLWAEDAETAQSLGAAADSLREAIAGVGLVPGAILVRAGAPAPQAPQSASGAGHYVDAQR
ncbi:flagellar hook-length control protein FliK [Devosia salina]|uniref:Flagellar hook-length control protein FliK n=1 Tax=Devosia salina TaxID=2860336 RepID=A0ABX8WKV5_9HYPH|nr:flagellar hook-length control protein FliK [Devosia salina]QYO78649.1 flagellar hook-length control protein FliK [Devosia salina]